MSVVDTVAALTPTSTVPRRMSLRVNELRWEADGVLSISLADPGGGDLPGWTPGAHVDVRLPNGIDRQYSLCSDPADHSCWRIAVLKEQTGRGGSQFIHEQLRPGQRVEVSTPLNNFPLVDADCYLFIAGGIGITALYPMIQTVQAAGRPWKLGYAGRTAAGMAFLRELAGWAENVELYPADTGERLSLETWTANVDARTAVYACGPERLLTELGDLSSGWPTGALHVEWFAPKSVHEPIKPGTFEVHCARSGITVDVDESCSVLEMLEAAGLPVPSSCREGVCGTCETPVLEGEIEHRDSLLSSDERQAQDTMMICVSRAHGDRLVLDV